jgi:GTP-binding protein
LVDVSIAPQEKDKQLLEFLASSDRRFLVVATKSDRLSNNQLHNALNVLKREHPSASVLPFSARTGAGKEQLWQEIRTVVDEFGEGALLQRG